MKAGVDIKMKKNTTLLLSKNLANISNLVSVLKNSFPDLSIAYDGNPPIFNSSWQ